MKKVLLLIAGVLVLSGCANKEMETFYDNTKAGGKIESYQMDLRIYGTFKEESFSEIVKIDNYKGKQFKIDYVSDNADALRPNSQSRPADIEGEKPEGESDKLTTEDYVERLENKASYAIDGKFYKAKDGGFEQVSTLLYSDPTVYLEPVNTAKKVEYLFEETIAETVYKVYTFKVTTKNMQPMLDNSVLSKIKLTEDTDAKVWVNKDEKIYKVEYYLKNKDNKNDKVTINASLFRIDLINDMSNVVKQTD